MRKQMLLLAAMAFMAVGATAEELRVADVTVPQNSTALIAVELNNPTTVYESFTFQIELPEGIVPVMVADNTPSVYVGSRFSGAVSSGYKPGNIATFARLTDGTTITSTEGILFSVEVKVDGEVAVGTTLTAKVSEITFTTPDLTKETLDPVSFNITVGEPDDGRIHFDETSTKLPTYTAGEKGDVTLKRTIKANTWSTIVLPFTLTKAKAETIFGSDVQLAEFSGFEVDYGDDEENVIPFGITINFATYTMTAKKGMTGGKPFLIKTSKDISVIEADDCSLVNVVSDVTKTDEFDTSGKFTGTFTKTTVPADGLFLNSNKFYYSTGQSNIKAFRGWFELGAVLNQETDFGVKMVIDGFETKVEGLGVKDAAGNVYDLSGRKVSKAQRGVYIVNGKKVVINK